MSWVQGLQVVCYIVFILCGILYLFRGWRPIP